MERCIECDDAGSKLSLTKKIGWWLFNSTSPHSYTFKCIWRHTSWVEEFQYLFCQRRNHKEDQFYKIQFTTNYQCKVFLISKSQWEWKVGNLVKFHQHLSCIILTRCLIEKSKQNLSINFWCKNSFEYNTNACNLTDKTTKYFNFHLFSYFFRKCCGIGTKSNSKA